MKGTRFNRLLVVDQLPSHNRRKYWLCRCDCGEYKTANTSSLKKGTIQSCGCLRKDLAKIRSKDIAGKNEIDLTGNKVGRWTVISKSKEKTKCGQWKWHCKCDCGKEKLVVSQNLRNGRSLSCGCLNREINSERSIGKSML